MLINTEFRRRRKIFKLNNYQKAWINYFITIFFFSTIEVVTKPFSGIFNPFQLTFLRFLFGGIFLLIILFIKGDIKKLQLSLNNIVKISLIGSINSIISMSLLQLSVKYSSSSTAAILVSSNPIFVLILANIFLKEKINLNKILAIISGIIGIVLILFSKNLGDSIKGIFFGILASISFGFYTIFTKKVLKSVDTLVFQVISFLGSSIIYYILLLLFNIPVFNFILNKHTLLLIIYISIFVTGVAYITFFYALSILEASVSSFSYLMKPVFSILFAFIFLHEIPNLRKVLGTIFIVLAIGIILFKPFEYIYNLIKSVKKIS